MSYKKHEWKKGDIITSANLNNIEEELQRVSNKLDETLLSEAKPTVSKILSPSNIDKEELAIVINSLIDALVEQGIIEEEKTEKINIML